MYRYSRHLEHKDGQTRTQNDDAKVSQYPKLCTQKRLVASSSLPPRIFPQVSKGCNFACHLPIYSFFGGCGHLQAVIYAGSTPFSYAFVLAAICIFSSFSLTPLALLCSVGIRSMASIASENRSVWFRMANSRGVSMLPFSL
jgi:hypothetical protein